jgi:hypothetical protein
MTIGSKCRHINWNGGYFLAVAIIKQAENDQDDVRLPECNRMDARMFLESEGIGGVYDLCLDYISVHEENKKAKESSEKGLTNYQYCDSIV